MPLPTVGEECAVAFQWTSASRRVPSIRKSARAMKRSRSSKISCCGVIGISAARCNTRMIDSHADSLRARFDCSTRFARSARIALGLRLLRRRSQSKEHLRSLLLSTAARAIRSRAAVRCENAAVLGGDRFFEWRVVTWVTPELRQQLSGRRSQPK